MTDLSIQDKISGGLWGAVVGDALGVPVEFQSRERLRRDPVRDMRDYGTYNQPAGTGSDDSSMMLCTVESLLDGFDTKHLGDMFVRWLNDAHWTPWEEVFDIGGTTQEAIKRLSQGVEPEQAGLNDEYSNGNGSLMRILPVALRYFESPIEELLDHAHRASTLTHRHIRCQIACGFYCALVSEMLRGNKVNEAYLRAINSTKAIYDQPLYSGELPAFTRIFSGDIGTMPESQVRSSGYVIHTLEASIWCLCNTESFGDAVLMAVNLGDDTDTTATVAGGLAGVEYGVDAIPSKWVDQLARRTDLEALFDQFMAKIL